jgi:hypothetical protein
MKKNLKAVLIFSLFVLSLGGAMLHLGFHPFTKHAYGYVPFVSAMISVIAIPILFSFRKTLNLAYLLNGFTAIIGVIVMSHFAVVRAPIWADVLMAFSKLLIGRAIFVAEIYHLENEAPKAGWRYIRYPNMGFWYMHLVTLSVVYYFGNLLWR